MKVPKLLIVVAVLALMLTGCSGPTPAPAASEPTAVPATAVVAPTAAPTVAAPPATAVAITAKEETPTPAPTVAASKYAEAPMLAELVTADKLPPVDERLPAEPVVVEPVDGVGKYGGVWHTLVSAPAMYDIRMTIYDPPIRWKPDYTGYEPGFFESYEWSADGKTVTFKLREGVKWSDGVPFTTDDLKFWWEDLALNPDYKTVKPRAHLWKSDKVTPIDITFPDKYTMVWASDQPQWVAPFVMAQGYWEWEPMMKPAHYLKQFHPKYTPGAKYEDLDIKIKWYENPDHPVTFAWRVAKFVAGERTIFERNPYYWKIDTEGNQLPYIDSIEVDLVPDKEARTLKISQGGYTTFRGTEDPRDIPFLLEQAEAGNYHLPEGWTKGGGAWPAWMINQDYSQTGDAMTDTPKDQEIREVLRNKTFRKALSVAIDRQRLIDVVWEGIGEPKGFTISPQSWHFVGEQGQQVYNDWAQSDAQYDPEQAAAWLDEIGMQKGADGFRTLPSGEPFELMIDIGDWGGDKVSIDGSETLKTFFEDVGIKVALNNLVGQPDFALRRSEGKYMLHTGDASELDLYTYPAWIFPMNAIRAWPQEGKWREQGGKAGWQPEPGSPAEKLLALYDQGMAEGDIQKRHELIWEAIKIHIEEGPFYLSATGDRQVPAVIQNNFRNVPETGILGPWAPSSPGNKHPEQFWIEE